jgi:hypothetical protein
MHRFEADGNLHKRPFPKLSIQMVQSADQHYQLISAMHQSNTSMFQAFLLREGRRVFLVLFFKEVISSP